MNRYTAYILRKLRSSTTIENEHGIKHLKKQNEDDELIKELLTEKKPCLIGRFGSGELNAVATYIRKSKSSKWPGEKSINFIKGELDTFWWHDGIRESLRNGAGMFSVSDSNLNKFAIRMIRDASYIDILGSWRVEEHLLKAHMKSCHKICLEALEPYFSDEPWSEVLMHKNVLIVHPYIESIKNQYAKRSLLFNDKRILPDFNLKTFKPLQTIAGNKDPRFESWFDGLKWMEDQIDNINFDVAIIGAGAYGLPLAAHIKRIGKKAVHLGGATQILFGIKGARWENKAEFEALFNKHWVKPLESEKPKGYKDIEGGCYW